MFGALLTQNTDFKCNSAICFGIGPVHDQLKTLQTTINRLAPVGSGFVPLVVDGFIGDKTVEAANAVAKIAVLPSPGTTHEAVAVNALDFTRQLADFVSMLVEAGVIAPINDTERAAAAALDTDLSKFPASSAAVAVSVIGKTTPSPEIDGVVQQTVAACRASRSSPACTRAKAMCRSVRGTAQEQLAEVKQICDATSTPLWVFLLAGGLGVGAIVGIGLLHRRRRMAEAFGQARDVPSMTAMRTFRRTRR